LIVFQFAISLFFIIGTLVMGNQIRFIKTKDRGFTTESVVTLRTNWDDHSKNPSILAERIRLLSGVEAVTLQVAPPMGFAQIINNMVYKGKQLVETSVALKAAKPEFIPLYRIPLLAGRNIVESDSLKEFVINETYSKQLGFLKPEEALGQFLYFNNKPYPIVGVVGDFHEASFHDPIGPSAIGTFAEFLHGIAIKFSVNTTPERMKPLLAQVEKLYKQLYPDEAFESHFIEDEIEWMHDGEQKTARLMNVAMIVTIFISCMGVFGLAMFTAELRTKEIGIRKVLGATAANIAAMLSKEFMLLIGIAILIASPVAWYFMNDWLLKFAYRVDLTPWIFVLAGLAALSIGLLTVSFQTVRAAVANPADSLRAE
jgi:ABC-type antimicrobial peptide transport system permease subunit